MTAVLMLQMEPSKLEIFMFGGNFLFEIKSIVNEDYICLERACSVEVSYTKSHVF